MKLKKLNSNITVYINYDKYRINWNKKVSKPQLACKTILKPFWENDLVFEEAPIPGSRNRIDLWNESKKIIIEVSPDSLHKNYNDFMHKNRCGFYKKLTTDNIKQKWCEDNGYTYISLDDNDIKNFSKQYAFEKFGVRL